MSKKNAKRIDFSKLPIGTQVRRRDGEVVTIVEQLKGTRLTWRVGVRVSDGGCGWHTTFGYFQCTGTEHCCDLVSVVSHEKAKPKAAVSKKPALPEGVFNVSDLVGKLLVIESDNNTGRMKLLGLPVSAGPFKSNADVDRHLIEDGIDTFEGSDRSSLDDLEHWGSDCLIVEVKRVVRQVPVVKVGCEVQDVSGIKEDANAR